MAEKIASRPERRWALREMVRLLERKELLLREVTQVIDDDSAPMRDTLVNAYLEEISAVEKQAVRSPLMRAYSEADWLDKAVVFFTGSIRDIALVVVSALLAAIITWLIVTGEFAGVVGSIFTSTFGVVAVVAAEPGLLLRDRQAVGSLIAALAAFVVALAFIVFSISWFFTKNAAKRKEARDFLTLIVTFFVGILTGWAL